MKIRYFISFTVALSIISSLAVAQFPVPRQLTDTTGRNVDAIVLSEAVGNIHIRRNSDGKEFDIPITKLSVADQAWLRSLKNKPEPPPHVDLSKDKPLPVPPPPVTPPVVTKPPIKYPKPEPIPDEKIMEEQVASGLVMPPGGKSALETVIAFKDGRTFPGYVYDVKDDRFWYAGVDMLQKDANLNDLGGWSRMSIEHWKTPFKPLPSPSMEFVINGKKVHASLVHANGASLTFIRESGSLLEKNTTDELDEMGRRFVKEWCDGTWMPCKWEWAISAEFTAVKPFSNGATALVKKDGKWGVVDTMGKYLQSVRFDKIREIPGSLNTKVMENGKWGLLDQSGTLVLTPDWEDVGDLHHGLVPVRSKGKWGYAAVGGKLAIPCTWDDAWRFSPVGTAVVTLNGKRGFVDRNGKVLVKPEWDGAIMHTPEGVGAVRRGRGWALVNPAGKLLCEPIWNFNWSERRFELGFIPAWPMGGSRTEKTLLGMDGKPGAVPTLRRGVCLPSRASKSPYPWNEVDSLPKQFPFPRKQDKQGKIGIIDLNGKVVFKPEFDEIHLLNSELFSVLQNGKSRIVARDGKILVEGDFSAGAVSMLDHVQAFRVLMNGKNRVFWLDGTAVLPDGSDSFQYVDNYGANLVFREKKGDTSASWWLVDAETRKSKRFDGVSRIYWVKSLADHDRIWLEDEVTKRWHFCKSDGTRLGLEMETQPHEWFFDEGFGVIRENSQCHFVNKEGKRVDLGDWEDARYFRNGFVAVKKGGKWGFIDTSGKLIAGCEYDEVGNFFIANDAPKAKTPLLASVCKEGKWGYINSQGVITIPLTGERPGNWYGGFIYQYSRERGGKYYDARGQSLDTNAVRKTQNENDQADFGEQLVTRDRQGLAGLKDDKGKNHLSHDWQSIAWLKSDLYVARSDSDGGLYSLNKGWLFRDNDQHRIQRNPYDGRINLNWVRNGLLVLEETPKWGFARWRNIANGGLVAHYALDGDTKDSSGMDNHAAGNQVQWTADKHGKANSALYLDGSGKFVTCPLSAEVSSAPRVTLVAWARADGNGPWRHVLGMCHNRSIEIASGWVARGTGGKWGCFGHRKIQVGEWVFLAASYDQDTRNVKFRVNEEFFEGKMNDFRHPGPFTLGGGGAQGFFKGAIDQVRIYGRLLSKEELEALYKEFLGTGDSKTSESQ